MMNEQIVRQMKAHQLSVLWLVSMAVLAAGMAVHSTAGLVAMTAFLVVQVVSAVQSLQPSRDQGDE